jgi:hypothetical protein
MGIMWSLYVTAYQLIITTLLEKTLLETIFPRFGYQPDDERAKGGMRIMGQSRKVSLPISSPCRHARAPETALLPGGCLKYEI